MYNKNLKFVNSAYENIFSEIYKLNIHKYSNPVTNYYTIKIFHKKYKSVDLTLNFIKSTCIIYDKLS